MNSTIAHRQTIFRPWSRVKRPAQVAGLAVWLGLVLPAAALTPGAPILAEPMEDFSAETYWAAAGRLFAAFEAAREGPIRPGEKGKVGLKVYTGSGPGLSTPVPLVRAVIGLLVERGFSAEDIFLIDKSEADLRACRFLPSLGEGGTTFEGHPIYILETGDFYDELWFYESPLPPRREVVLTEHLRGKFSYRPGEGNRRTYLPTPLLLDVDFWINLPVYSDHSVLGINGALTNATLWNASNTARFFHSETSGAAAVAEMAAVPELAESWLFSIVSLERYQFVGGPRFRSLYTVSEPVLLLGADPVALDSRMYRKMDEWREKLGFPEIEGGLALLDYASRLNLGEVEGEISRSPADGEVGQEER